MSTSQPLLIAGSFPDLWNFNGLIGEVAFTTEPCHCQRFRTINASMRKVCKMHLPLSAVPNPLTVPGERFVSAAPLTGSQPMTQQWHFKWFALDYGVRISGSTSNVLEPQQHLNQ